MRFALQRMLAAARRRSGAGRRARPVPRAGRGRGEARHPVHDTGHRAFPSMRRGVAGRSTRRFSAISDEWLLDKQTAT